MLADLAEENEITSNVDDDSVLGSQYSTFSEPIKNDLEEEEIEDLNITNLDLDSLSSWESMYNQRSSHHVNMIKVVDNKQNTESTDDLNVTEENNGDVTLVNFPQVDGVDDLYESMLEHEKNITNCFIDKDNTVCCTAVQCLPKTITRNSNNNNSVINARRDYAIYISHRNLNLMDIIQYIVNNPNSCYLKKELYNFVNRYYFHIFLKTCKNLQDMNVKQIHTDTSVVVRKTYYLKDNEKRIVYDKKTEEELYVARCQLQPDHRDLDVYDIDEIETFETLEHINCVTDYEKDKCNCEDSKSYVQERVLLNSNHCLYHKLCNFLMKFKISNVDGATITDSSDTESEADVTIDRQEERVCIYKSDKKNAPQNIIQITPKKRKLDFQDDRESPSKRRNVTVKTPKRKYNSPGKTSRSPQLSGNYSPLNITITSPKSSKSPIRQCKSPKRNQYALTSDVPSTSTFTPKHKIHPLRVSLLREKFLNSDLGNYSSNFIIFMEGLIFL